ncbi:unnamed protein product [Adineta steineri]|uniref:Sperm microtubule inner protein 1 C-terminal domain-containing protein n=1 Tax=Adineta steineri TaxID=433720 RepID=A0A818VU23_9BILA|nr:unnamed protein product [Adineta steineri]CAF3716093.1 unnamed protein product [Adineta steineri]
MARMTLDTRSQNAWKELIEKEAVTRISWNQRFKPNSNDDEWFKRAFYTQATSKPTARFLPTIVFPPKPKSRYNPIDTLDELENKTDTEHNSNILQEMYPVEKEYKDVLKDGFSKEGKGRYKYLNLRNEIPLEQKYQYPVTSTMEYRWKLNTNKDQFKVPLHARGKLIEDSFYRRNGAFQ